jgi:hypothetical protein
VLIVTLAHADDFTDSLDQINDQVLTLHHVVIAAGALIVGIVRTALALNAIRRDR